MCFLLQNLLLMQKTTLTKKIQNMKNKLFLLFFLPTFCQAQQKTVNQIEQHVYVRLDKINDIVYIVDSNNVQLHPQINILEMDTSIWNHETVYLFYGDQSIISWNNNFIAYDDDKTGFVYYWKEN